MNDQRVWMRGALIPALALVIGLGGTSIGLGQTPFFPFVEDFESPFDDNPVTWVPATITDDEGNSVTTQLEPVTGGLALSNPAQFPPLNPGLTFSLGGAYVFEGGQPVLDASARARAVLQLSDTETFGSIFFRGQDVAPAGDGGAYFANINGTGRVLMGDFLDPSSYRELQTTLDPVAAPVALELAVVGRSLTATAWDAAGPRPESPPSVTLTDDEARPLGLLGLNVGRFSDDPTGATATFYNYEVAAIPEPTAFPLLLLGLAAVSCRRR
jgi:hypothetical protein